MTDEPTAAIERLVPCPLCGNGVVGLTEKEAASARATLEAACPTASGDAIERAWRAGFDACRRSANDDAAAFELTDDVEKDAWMESDTRFDTTLSPKPVDPAKENLICDKCGKAIDAKPGETYRGSTNGKAWHYGCAPSVAGRVDPAKGDDWRCVHCKFVVNADREPDRCPECRNRAGWAHLVPAKGDVVEALREAVMTLLAEAKERGGSLSNGEKLGCNALATLASNEQPALGQGEG